MKSWKILLVACMLIVVNDAMAQVRSTTKGEAKEVTEKPTRPAKGKTQVGTQSEEPATTRPGQQADEAVLNDLTTAEKCKARAAEKAKWVDEQVGGINPSQRKQIYSIFEATYLDVKAYWDTNPEMSRAELKEYGAPKLNEAKSKSMEVLTPEQRAKLGAGNAGSSTNYVDKSRQQTQELHAVVNLSAEQQDQVMNLNQELWTEGREWKSNNAGASSADKKAYGKEIMKKRLEGYKSILTEEQIDKFIEHRQSNKGHDKHDGHDH